MGTSASSIPSQMFKQASANEVAELVGDLGKASLLDRTPSLTTSLNNLMVIDVANNNIYFRPTNNTPQFSPTMEFPVIFCLTCLSLWILQLDLPPLHQTKIFNNSYKKME